MNEPSQGLKELITNVISLCAGQGHTFNYERVGTSLVQIFYNFAFAIEREGCLPRDQLAKPITGAFRLQKAQEGSTTAVLSSDTVCGHIFAKGEAVYRCRDCALDDTCVLCSDCFDEDAHRGHNVSYSVHSSGGCCDCGDQEAWKATFACAKHGSNISRASIAPREVPQHVHQHLTDVIDFVLATFAQSPEIMLPPRSPAEIRRQVGIGGADGPFASGKGPWACVLWNDEKHNFAQVIDQVQRAIPTKTKVQATQTAVAVDSCGRDTILVSHNADALYSCSSIIASIDLRVTVRAAQTTFCEDVVGCFIEYLLDVCSANFYGDRNAFATSVARILLEPMPLLEASALAPATRFERLLAYDIRMWKKARQTLQSLYIRLLLLSASIKSVMGTQYCRMYPRLVEAFLLNDREPDHSQVSFGVQVLTVPSLVKRLLEPDLSEGRVTSFLDTLIDILVAFFAEQISENNVDNRAPRRLLLPPKRLGLHVDPDSPAFKHKRYFHILHDLSRLFESPAARVALPAEPRRIGPFVAFLDLFSGMHPSTRAVQQHVEYESDTWITAFNATIQISRLAKLCGETFAEASTPSIALVLRSILVPMVKPVNDTLRWHDMSWCGRSYRLIDFSVATQAISFHHPLHWLFAEIAKNVQALSSEALVQAGYSNLPQLIFGQSPTSSDVLYQVLLAAIETPMSVCALLAQVRAGVWVRNGFTMRIQSMHYREYSLRETTFDQDVSLLQLWLAVMGPDVIIAAILDRFDLAQWLQNTAEREQSTTVHSIYSQSQCTAVLDDLASLLITLVSELSIPAAWSKEQRLRREVIHFLAIGQCAMSELTKRIAETYIDDAAFERVLQSVAIYRPPASTNDHGMYGLKRELLLEVDPYYYRYSRNQRDDAKKAVLAYLRENNEQAEAGVIVPQAAPPLSGPYISCLDATYTSPIFIELIFHALRRASEQDTEEHIRFSETVIDQMLHLVMLALVNCSAEFCQLAVSEVFGTGSAGSLLDVLVTLERDARLDGNRPKIRWCLDRISQISPHAVETLRRSQGDSGASLVRDAKKEAAQARKAALLKQFASMQESFLNSELANALNEEAGDDEDSMTDEATSRRALGSCIVCQEVLDSEKEPYGVLGLFQSSRLVTTVNPSFATNHLSSVLRWPVDLDQPHTPESASVGARGAGAIPGLYASSCGHSMHHRCFETYCRSVEARHSIQHHRNHPENIDRREYICPLCKSLGNVLLPVDERNDSVEAAPTPQSVGSVSAWIEEWLGHQARGWPLHGGRAVQRLMSADASGQLSAWLINEDLPAPRKREADSLLHVSLAERGILERICQVVHALTAESLSSGDHYIAEELVAYTIRCIEIAARGQQHAIIDLPEQNLRLLRSLLLVLRELVDVNAGSIQGTEHAAAALSSRFAASKRLHYFSTGSHLPLFVSAVAICSSQFGQYCILTYYDELALAMVQALYCCNDLEVSDQLRGTENGEDVSYHPRMTALTDMARFLQESLRDAVPSQYVLTFRSPQIRLLGAFMLPVLRRMAIVKRASFNDASERAMWLALQSEDGNEYDRLLRYVGIPDIAEFLHDPDGAVLRQRTLQLASGYMSELFGPGRQDSLPPALLTEFPSVYTLTPLPHRLDLLVASLRGRQCPRCQTAPPDPAICLLCGQLVCNQTFCCMETSNDEEPIHGECNTHMWQCGGSVGIYFLVNKPSILYLYADNGSFSPSPYLDEHGEANNKRNLFKYLHMPRYEEIRKNYVNQIVPTFVARKLDSLVDLGGWTTL